MLQQTADRSLRPHPAPADVAVTAATALALLAWNNLVAAGRWHSRHYVAANLLGTAGLLALARSRGLRAHHLGLSPAAASTGARHGGAVSAVLLAGLVAAVVSPRHRGRLRDERITGMSDRAVAYHAAVRVPLGTVVWEETAFRAVLPALLQRVLPTGPARAANTVLFGLWHVRPTLDAVRLNTAFPGRGRAVAAVAGGVAFTAATDLLFSGLRRTSGSLLAPALVHLASNTGGTLAAAVAGRTSARVSGRTSARVSGSTAPPGPAPQRAAS